jgi:hypothetical protein
MLSRSCRANRPSLKSGVMARHPGIMMLQLTEDQEQLCNLPPEWYAVAGGHLPSLHVLLQGSCLHGKPLPVGRRCLKALPLADSAVMFGHILSPPATVLAAMRAAVWQCPCPFPERNSLQPRA